MIRRTYFASLLALLVLAQAGFAQPSYDVVRTSSPPMIDGILGAGTRAAVQDMQKKLGMPADAWPTAALLGRL